MVAREPNDSGDHRKEASCDFFGPDLERLQLIHAEGRCHGHIGGVASAGHEHPTNAGSVVTGVKGVPLAAQERFEPGAEVHRIRRQWHADVAQITGTVTGRNVQAAAEGDRQVHVIAADAHPLAIDLQRGPIVPGSLIVETNVVMNEVANSLDARPARLRARKQTPRDVLQFAVHFAIAASQQKLQNFLRQILDVVLPGVADLQIGQSAVLDDRVVAKRDVTCRNDGPAAAIAVQVKEL